eukprot:TRINITY_DN2779_c0_g1_i2.p1 TRINITY_DN2779_c0_g1~~TRINITY_DN2779_c0_g1_i2.p1  ORF type:complete len:275 (+),score=91.48 TRINITY_DN2779_c0_g1_i2:143-967(+)
MAALEEGTVGASGASPKAELKRQLEEIERQQQQISERLREANIAGRRFLRPGPRAGSGPGGPWAGPRGAAPAQQRSGNPGQVEDGRGEKDDVAPTRKRLLSSVVVKVNGNGPVIGDAVSSAAAGAEEGEAARKWQRLSSGRQASAAEETGAAEAVLPPPTRVVPPQDPASARRNRRIFGALLLGTLEKFKEEDKKLQGTEAFVRRSHSLQRAEQRKVEDSELLRKRQQEEEEEKRKRDLMLRARLAAKADEKQLELLFLHWEAHRERLLGLSLR